MSDPLELSVEKLAVALLNQSSDVLAIIPTERICVQSSDTDPDGDNANRIVCKARKSEVDSYGHRPDIVLTWRVPCEIAVHTVKGVSAADLYSVIAAISAAMNEQPETAAAAIADAANITEWHDTDEGDSITDNEERKRVKTWNFLADA